MPIPAVDPSAPPSRLNRLLTPFAVSKAGRWYGINIGSRVDPKLMKLTKGRVKLGSATMPTLLLTVRGRKSGVEREVPLVYFTDGDDVILMASSFGRAQFPAWYHNIKANPDVILTAGGVRERYIASEVQGPDRDDLYEQAKRLYSGYGSYEERTAGIRNVPVLRLRPSIRPL